YDASGTAGIINIRLKKNKNYGTNGSITLGYATGKYSKYNTSLSLNNRSKKFNTYANYGNNWGIRQNEFYLYREQNPIVIDQGSINKRWGLMHNYKAGVDYTMNKKNSFGIMVNGNYNDVHGSLNSKSIIGNFETDTPHSILHSHQTMTIAVNNFNLNLNQHFSATLGHDLTT